ncbi:chromosome segregation ATPases [Candidatus Scalindua japonica]|uniref:Chromosome segregation ATPases n=1 Tax=Candidatus Scalindua japonica TaxID=1284222 RepID=A0A286TUK0_9BACT|nr:hypothetical protein [Candidatus Scalindua japonica]GAX59558.1 chromosome segregation ATPases [Candidatus Scalindua japonica]
MGNSCLNYSIPNELGSGAGQFGTSGGGLARIVAGSISMDGGIYSYGSDSGSSVLAGAGSGGGIYIEAETIMGSGEIIADGGNSVNGRGGGGGRVAVYYNDTSGFNMNNIRAYGGNGVSSSDGGAGTVYLKSSTQVNGDLVVDNNNLVTSGFSTPLISIGTGSSTDLTVDTLKDTTRSWRPNEIIGIFLNPNINQGTTPATVFKLLSNDATSITVDNSLNNLTDVGSIGDTYIGEHFFDNLSVINGAKVETSDRVNFNSLNLTGGELQAENIYQIGKSETSPIDKLVKHQEDDTQRVKNRRRITNEGLKTKGDRRNTKSKVKLKKEELQIISKEFNTHKVDFSIPEQQHDKETIKEKTSDNYQETAGVINVAEDVSG